MEKKWVEELDHVSLEHTDWLEWFYIDFLPAVGKEVPPRLLIGIAEGSLHRLLAFLVADRLKGDIGEDFLTDIEKPWGYGGVLEPYAKKNDFEEFAVAIPQVEKDVGRCTSCLGKKKDGYDDSCIHCNGTGRETKLDWKQIDLVAATLSVLSEMLLDNPDKKLLVGINTKRKQLLSVCFSFGKERHQVRIGATLAAPFGDYLRAHSWREFAEVKEATKAAYVQMFPGRDKQFGDSSFQAAVHDYGQPIINVPGDACGLYVDGFDDCLREPSGPMNLTDHNVDGAHQQITLLCGLAALCNMARRELYRDLLP
jgi:hypothetical protein